MNFANNTNLRRINVMNEEEIADEIMFSLNWDNIPDGDYVVRLSKYGSEHEVEITDMWGERQ